MVTVKWDIDKNLWDFHSVENPERIYQTAIINKNKLNSIRIKLSAMLSRIRINDGRCKLLAIQNNAVHHFNHSFIIIFFHSFFSFLLHMCREEPSWQSMWHTWLEITALLVRVYFFIVLLGELVCSNSNSKYLRMCMKFDCLNCVIILSLTLRIYDVIVAVLNEKFLSHFFFTPFSFLFFVLQVCCDCNKFTKDYGPATKHFRWKQ